MGESEGRRGGKERRGGSIGLRRGGTTENNGKCIRKRVLWKVLLVLSQGSLRVFIAMTRAWPPFAFQTTTLSLSLACADLVSWTWDLRTWKNVAHTLLQFQCPFICK